MAASLEDYDAFLQAYRNREIRRLAVARVERIRVWRRAQQRSLLRRGRNRFADPRCELGLWWARSAKASAEFEQRPLHKDVEQQAERHDDAACDNDQQQ